MFRFFGVYDFTARDCFALGSRAFVLEIFRAFFRALGFFEISDSGFGALSIPRVQGCSGYGLTALKLQSLDVFGVLGIALFAGRRLRPP